MNNYLKEFIEQNVHLVETEQFRELFKQYPQARLFELTSALDLAEIDYKSDFIKFSEQYLEDPSLESFLTLKFDSWTLPEFKEQITKYSKDIEKFSNIPFMEEEADKGLLYTKYETFARKCKEFYKQCSKHDPLSLKMKDLSAWVDYTFPYGYKQFKDYYKRDENIIYIGTVLSK